MLERQPRRRPIRDSYRQRGIRVRAQKTGSPEATTVQIDRSALAAQKTHGSGPRAGSVSTWAMLIKRVYEVDPLECPCCGGQIQVVSFIEQSQQEVIGAELGSPLRVNIGKPALQNAEQ